MGLTSRITGCLRTLFHKRQIESQLDEEIRAYVDIVTDERSRQGCRPQRLVAPRWVTSGAWSR